MSFYLATPWQWGTRSQKTSDSSTKVDTVQSERNSLRSDAKKSMTEVVSRKVELTAELPLRWTTINTPSLLQSDVRLRRFSYSKWAFKDDK